MAAMAVAVGRGPLLLVVRAGLRAAGGRRLVRRWQRAATWGLGAGLITAPALAGATLGGQAAVTAAVLGLALLLFSMDLAWRWLPLEWTLPLLSLGLLAGFLGDRSVETLAGAVVGGGILLALQIIFRRWRGVEALGTGDIWLTAGLGCFAGPATIAWVLGLAALSGLAVEGFRKAVRTTQIHNRWGVAFGSHIIALYLIVSAL
jgi:prepilin signal peptidase PulO-like enzyme (type II secretory pathway)